MWGKLYQKKGGTGAYTALMEMMRSWRAEAPDGHGPVTYGPLQDAHVNHKGGGRPCRCRRAAAEAEGAAHDAQGTLSREVTVKNMVL